MKRIRHESRAETDKKMRTERVRVADAMWYTKQVAIIFARQPRSDERSRFFSCFNNQYRIRYPHHKPVAFGEVTHVRRHIRRILRNHAAARFQNFFREHSIAPRIENRVVQPGAGEGERMKSGRKRRLVRTSVHAERKAANY